MDTDPGLHAEVIGAGPGSGDDPSEPHPDVARLVARFARAGVPTNDTLDVATAREISAKVVALQHPPVDVARVDDVDAGGVPVRVYRPVGDPSTVIVYLHGGGFVLGSVDVADAPIRALAVATGATIVSVEYRLAPEAPFPAPLDDCVTALRWVLAHRSDLGGDRLVLFGDSAGGALAAAGATIIGDGIDALVLLYPTLAPPGAIESASYVRFADGPLITRGELEWYWRHYLGDHDPSDPLAAPLLATDLDVLPTTTVVVGGLDPLRDDGVTYARRLDAAGVDVRLIEVAGAAHGFWWMDRAMSQAAEVTAALVPVFLGHENDLQHWC